LVFLHALDDRVDVQRADGPHVEDLALDAVLGEPLRGVGAEVHGAAPRDQRHRVAGADLAGAAEGDVVLLLGDVGLVAQHALALEEEDRVGVADRGLEQALGVVGVARDRHLEARHVRVEPLDAPGVGRAELAPGAVVAAEDDRASPLAARHVEHLGRVVEDRVGRDEAERPAHELDDGLEPVHRGPDAHAREPVLGDRAVDDALGPELVEHALADLVRAVVLGDLLADQEDGLVAAHLLAHRLAQRLAVLDHAVALAARAGRLSATNSGSSHLPIAGWMSS
jgi:hypothetical protein